MAESEESFDQGIESHRWMGFHMGAEEEYIEAEMKRQEDFNPLAQTPQCERVGCRHQGLLHFTLT